VKRKRYHAIVFRPVFNSREVHRKLKYYLAIWLMLFSLFALCDPVQKQSAASSKNDFRYLSGFGQWIEEAPYGECWKPSVIASWNPLENGRWIRTQYGLTWFSYEPFGWIVYHYGNWVLTASNGWLWIPGYQWSAANVRWIQFNDYAGWAAAPPSGTKLPDPWDPLNRPSWKITKISDLDRDDVKTSILKIKSETAPDPKMISRTEPATDIEKGQANLFQEGKLQRIDFPVALNNRLVAYRNNVGKNVLLPVPAKNTKRESIAERKTQRDPIQ
jgi:uncharacterized protein DUF6600